MKVLKKVSIIMIIVCLSVMNVSCFQLGPPRPPEADLKGPYIITGLLNTAISKGTYAACYGDYVFYFDSAVEGVKALNTVTDEESLICPIHLISLIAVNDEYVFFATRDRIYQAGYSGEIIDTSERFNMVKSIAVLGDFLYVFGDWPGSYYDSLGSLPVNNIHNKPVNLLHDIDYDSIEFTQVNSKYYNKLWVHIEQIDAKNSLVISLTKTDGQFDIRHGVDYTILQDGYGVYGGWMMIDEYSNLYASIPYTVKSGILDRSDGMQIELPSKYHWNSLYKSDEKGRFILLGQYFGTLGDAADSLMRYHQSDILLEIDIENKVVETLIETLKGERIVGYWNGRVILLNNELISIYDPISGEKKDLYRFKKIDPDKSLDIKVLGGYLFVYEFDYEDSDSKPILLLKEKLDY